MDDQHPIVERPVTFGPQGSLVGVWTASRDGAEGRPAIVMLTSGIVHRAGPWRLHTQLGRRLAILGFPSLRFDLSGIGDSARRTDVTSLPAAIASDISAALEYLRERQGVDRFVLFGLCSGAHDAVLSGLADSRVVGVIAVDLEAEFRNWKHLVRYVRLRMFDLTQWSKVLARGIPFLRSAVSTLTPQVARRSRRRALGLAGVRPRLALDELAQWLDRLLGRGVRLLLVFTEGLVWNYNHPSQFREALPGVAGHPNLTHHFLPGTDHTLTVREERTNAFQLMEDWLAENFPGGDDGVSGEAEPAASSA